MRRSPGYSRRAWPTGGSRPGPASSTPSRRVRSSGWKVGLVTTTSPENVAALLDALSPQLSAADFDVIVDSSSVTSAQAGQGRLRVRAASLGEVPDDCVAVEDNVGGVQAAVAAGVPVRRVPQREHRGR